jgi:hypothetical protein
MIGTDQTGDTTVNPNILNLENAAPMKHLKDAQKWPNK